MNIPLSSDHGFCTVTFVENCYLLRVYRHVQYYESSRPLLVQEVPCMSEDDAHQLAREKLAQLGGRCARTS